MCQTRNIRAISTSVGMPKRTHGTRSIIWQTRTRTFWLIILRRVSRTKQSWRSRCENLLRRIWNAAIRRRICRRRRISLITRWLSSRRSGLISMPVNNSTEQGSIQLMRKIYRFPSYRRRFKSLRSLNLFSTTRSRSWNEISARKRFKSKSSMSRLPRWDLNKSISTALTRT